MKQILGESLFYVGPPHINKVDKNNVKSVIYGAAIEGLIAVSPPRVSAENGY
jgi:hypothetical protein